MELPVPDISIRAALGSPFSSAIQKLAPVLNCWNIGELLTDKDSLAQHRSLGSLPTSRRARISTDKSLASIGNASGQTFGAEGILIRGVFDKTSCASGAPPSMKIGFSGSHVETGQSVIQASVVGDCLKVDSLCDDTDPVDKTDPRR